jgi:hypothetical protein
VPSRSNSTARGGRTKDTPGGVRGAGWANALHPTATHRHENYIE